MEQKNKCHDESLSPKSPGTFATDEVDLVQLFLILLKRKYLIGGTCLVCLLGGLVFAFLVPKKYTYSTAIEIGATLVDTTQGILSRAIEPPEAVLAKLESSYIPFAVMKMAESPAEGLFEVEARIPKNSDMIILSSKGPAEMAESYRLLHNLATKPLLDDHIRIIDVPRRSYQVSMAQEEIKLKTLEDPRVFVIEEKSLLISLETAKMQLVKLDDQKKLLISQDKRLAETQTLLRQQIKKVEENLAQAHASRPKAIAEVNNEAQAMTMLLITNQIEQNEKRLSELQERLTIGLENQKEVLQKEVAENRRAFALQKDEIAKLQSELVKLNAKRESDQNSQKNVILSIKNKIDDLRETRTLGVAVRSVKPMSPRKIVVLALSGILGLVGGVMLAFFSEFVRRVRQRVDKEDR